MTVGKSLVEDMARAMEQAGARELLKFTTTLAPPYPERAGQFGAGVRAIYAAMEAARLSVLKDRLPADDRELVEWLRELAAHPSVFDWQQDRLERIADRITALSASSPAGRADAPSRSSASRPFGDHPA